MADTVLRNGTMTSQEVLFRRADGQPVWTLANVSILDSSTDGTIFHSTLFDITDRKRVEERLRESADQFRTMANAIPQLACMAHADGFILWYNERWYEYTGTTPEQMEGWGWQSVHDPDVLPKVMEGWREAITTGQPFEMEFPLRGADGRFRTFLTRVQPLKDSHGNVVQWFGTNTDVDELKRMEESLRDTQARLNSTLAAGSIGTWTWDIVNDRLTADEFTARMFAIEPDAAAKGMSAKAYLRAILEEEQPRVADALARAIESCGHYDIEYPVRMNDGGIRWLQARGRVESDAAGNASNFHGAVMDITERKRAVEALRESEQRLRLFIEYAPAALAMFDHEMRYLAASRRWLADYGFPDGDLAGRSHYDLFPEVPENWKVVHKRGLAGEVVRADEDRFVRADGCVKWLRWEVRPWHRADGTIGGIVIFTEDITDRKMAKEALNLVNTDLERGMQQLAEANRVLKTKTQENEAFVYSVSHDLRSPLVNLQGFSKELARSAADLRALLTAADLPQPVRERSAGLLDGQVAKSIRFIQTAVTRLSVIIDALLRLSRAGRLVYQRQRVDVQAIVTRIVESLKITTQERAQPFRSTTCRPRPAIRPPWSKSSPTSSATP